LFGALKLSIAAAENGSMSFDGPEAPTYTADQSQYVAPLQSWPPQASQAPVHVAPRRSIVLPWVFVALGVIIPLSALITGIWAMVQARGGDRRYVTIAVVGIAVFLLLFWVRFRAGMGAYEDFTRGDAPAGPTQPSTP
jgi:hypothetical protein